MIPFSEVGIMKFRLQLKHDETRLIDAFGIKAERVEELDNIIRVAMLRTDCISKTVELVAEECRNLNELVLASMMIGYLMGANRPVVIL